MAVKKCSKCGIEKPATREFFYPHKEGKYGFRPDCIQCFSKRTAAYVERNRERLLAQRAAFREANRDKLRKMYMDFYWRNKERLIKESIERNRRNPEAYNAKLRKWRKANRAKVEVWGRNRRAKLKGSVGTHTIDDVLALMKAQRGMCVYCKTDIRKKYHVDHILPVSLGGSNDRTNIQLLCPSCNLKKRAKHPEEFAREIGLLV